MYIDATQSFVYESSLMSENQLPPVYVRKGHKRHRIDSYSMLACYTVFALTCTQCTLWSDCLLWYMSDDVSLLTVILADCNACLVMYCAAKL